MSSRLADDKRNDFRIEAALAKLYGSELGWQAIDTMIQIRGGRGYETAESLQARGEKPVPAEQLLRDMRINRIFEGSTEIMHLLIAREAVDQHLQAAGGVLDPQTAVADKLRDAVKAGGFYASWFPKLAVGEGQKPSVRRSSARRRAHVRYVERGSRKLARSTFYLMGRYQAKLEHKGHLLGRIVDIGAELYAIACACVYAQTIAREDATRRDSAFELADLFAKQARRRADALFHDLEPTAGAQYRAAAQVLEAAHAWFDEDVLDPSGEGAMLQSQAAAKDRLARRPSASRRRPNRTWWLTRSGRQGAPLATERPTPGRRSRSRDERLRLAYGRVSHDRPLAPNRRAGSGLPCLGGRHEEICRCGAGLS